MYASMSPATHPTTSTATSKKGQSTWVEMDLHCKTVAAHYDLTATGSNWVPCDMHWKTRGCMQLYTGLRNLIWKTPHVADTIGGHD
eukprot:m.980541 g.980541  ORF g.980541 m.980541 type:complete len:86 (+) comp23969_c0_seq2:720-977(+)